METEGTQETGQYRGRGRFSRDRKRMGLVECCHAALQHRITNIGATDTCSGGIWDDINAGSSGIWSDGVSGIGSSIVIECNGIESYTVESEGIGIDIKSYTVESEGIGIDNRQSKHRRAHGDNGS